jgi:hypothetical protein
LFLNLRKQNLNKKLANSEQILEGAKQFIEKIQQTRKNIEKNTVDQSGATTTVAQTSTSNEADGRTGIEIYNKLKDDGREPVMRVVNDSFFDIRVAGQNSEMQAQARPPSSLKPSATARTSLSTPSDSTRRTRGISINKFLNRNNSTTNAPGTNAGEQKKSLLKNWFGRK